MFKLYEPSKKQIHDSNIFNYQVFLNQKFNKKFDSYKSLWKWSIQSPQNFWESIADYFQIPLKKKK